MSVSFEQARRLQLRPAAQIASAAQRAVAAGHPYPDCFNGCIVRVPATFLPIKGGDVDTENDGSARKAKRDSAGSARVAEYFVGAIVGVVDPIPSADRALELSFVVEFGGSKATVPASSLSDDQFSVQEHALFAAECARHRVTPRAHHSMEEALSIGRWLLPTPAPAQVVAKSSQDDAATVAQLRELVRGLQLVALELAEEKDSLHGTVERTRAEAAAEVRASRLKVETAERDRQRADEQAREKLATLDRQLQEAQRAQLTAESHVKELGRKVEALERLKAGVESLSKKVAEASEASKRYSDALGRIAATVGLQQNADIASIEARVSQLAQR